MARKGLSRAYSGQCTELDRAPGVVEEASKQALSEESSLLSSGFVLRAIEPAAVRTWLGIQLFGLLLQFGLWREVADHASSYTALLAKQCAPNHRQHNVCLGSHWNLSLWEKFTLSRKETHDIFFSTASLPPTFLLSVDPYPADAAGDGLLDDIVWTLDLARLNPPPLEKKGFAKHYQMDHKIFTIEDMSQEAAAAVRDSARGRVDWRATLGYREGSSSVQPFVVFVEDATGQSRLPDSAGSSMCSFGHAWRSFAEQTAGLEQSHHFAVIWWCSLLLGLLALMQLSLVVVVWLLESKYSSRVADFILEHFRVPKQHQFHAFVATKSALQDFPQQMCVAYYLLGWYEADGVKCQLCLFDSSYCEQPHPFHLWNCAAIAFLLLSSVSNQLLVRPARKSRAYDEFDACYTWAMRISVGCVSVLPFTTAIYNASGNVLTLPGLLHAAVAIPCLVGWGVVAGFFAYPLVACYARAIESCEKTTMDDD
eukprot:TRINITY_DN42232_c0_g1_i1.p1 TRINITY_DN42232_c0_g1~~TRINITY_DN42232_c0_g1_i1.p1  ORF type:complete len:482 (+),score=71.59 TRINITY_DN42232_c0_g1_i1:121-1566(+)